MMHECAGIGAGVHLEHWLAGTYIQIHWSYCCASEDTGQAGIYTRDSNVHIHACACACMQLSSNTATTQQGLPATTKTYTPSPGLDPAVTQNQIRPTPCCIMNPQDWFTTEPRAF